MNSFKFPGGEMHVTVGVSDYPYFANHTRYNLWSSDDIMTMLLSEDARYNYRREPERKICLPYVPYARQDRVANKGEALSIRVMADFINYIRADLVEIWDPHSDVTPALIRNSDIISQLDLIRSSTMINSIGLYDAFISPDAGAEKKTFRLAKYFEKTLIRAIKHRDTATGRISGVSIIDKLPKKKCKLLVINDICDGGRTFTELAKIIKDSWDSPLDVTLDLYVTHGIFSKGLDELSAYYDKIFVANLHPEVDTDDNNVELLYHPLKGFYNQ